MKIRTFALLSCLFLTVKVYGQAAMIPTVNSMTNNDLWTALTNINASGETMFGKCRVLNATTCASCACDYYFRANIVGSLGMYGWPKNPSSGDSTGCLGSGCWGGYSAAMCTADIKANARAMLLDALNKSACGNPVPPTITGGVNITEVSKFFFVDPKNNGGKVACGTTGLGTKVGEIFQFTRLPSSICKAAYLTALKSAGNDRGEAKFITMAQYDQQTLSNEEIQNAAAVVGQLNESYNVLTLDGVQKFLDYTDAQYAAMTPEDVAVFYVAVGKDINKLPAPVKSRVIPDKFDDTRAAGDNFITEAEISAAEATVTQISKGVVEGKQLTLEGAVNYLQSSPSGSTSSSSSGSYQQIQSIE